MIKRSDYPACASMLERARALADVALEPADPHNAPAVTPVERIIETARQLGLLHGPLSPAAYEMPSWLIDSIDPHWDLSLDDAVTARSLYLSARWQLARETARMTADYVTGRVMIDAGQEDEDILTVAGETRPALLLLEPAADEESPAAFRVRVEEELNAEGWAVMPGTWDADGSHLGATATLRLAEPRQP